MTFKVGDRVERIQENDVCDGGFMKTGVLYIVSEVKASSIKVKGSHYAYEPSYFKLDKEADVPVVEYNQHSATGSVAVLKPHKHAALIKAWAENPSLEFQFRGGGLQSSCWFPMCKSSPDWSASEVRIKPEPKPDRVTVKVVGMGEDSCGMAYPIWNRNYVDGGRQVRFTFDGETNVLKAVELV